MAISSVSRRCPYCRLAENLGCVAPITSLAYCTATVTGRAFIPLRLEKSYDSNGNSIVPSTRLPYDMFEVGSGFTRTLSAVRVTDQFHGCAGDPNGERFRTIPRLPLI